MRKKERNYYKNINFARKESSYLEERKNSYYEFF